MKKEIIHLLLVNWPSALNWYKMHQMKLENIVKLYRSKQPAVCVLIRSTRKWHKMCYKILINITYLNIFLWGTIQTSQLSDKNEEVSFSLTSGHSVVTISIGIASLHITVLLLKFWTLHHISNKLQNYLYHDLEINIWI